MDLWTWMFELVSAYGYLGAFLVCIAGNASIFLPIPFALVVYAFGSTLNPLLLGIVCGIGSTIGEMISYMLGWWGRNLIESRYGSRLNAARKLIERYGVVSIFLFALLPIPDDLILVPLGMMKYSAKNTFIAMLLGKTILCITLAYAGAYSWSFLKDIFTDGGFLGVGVSMILLIVIIVVLLKVDWAKILDNKNIIG